LSTDRLLPEARALVGEIAGVIAEHPNQLIVRGHTDALPYAAGRSMSNWRLSAARADATRQALVVSGVGSGRFERIEGVADREPFNTSDRYDPRNRRMSVTLAWSRGAASALTQPNAPAAEQSGAQFGAQSGPAAR
jgi:chemotaxis protein MotB